MTYLDYQKYGQTERNVGCDQNSHGYLSYKIKENSWTWNETGSVFYRPIGASYWSDAGTRHFIQANERYMIGDHYSIIEIRSDIDTIVVPDSKFVKIELEILDCKVSLFEPSQLFENMLLNLNETVTLPFGNYTQTPNCRFEVNYTTTVIEKSF